MTTRAGILLFICCISVCYIDAMANTLDRERAIRPPKWQPDSGPVNGAGSLTLADLQRSWQQAQAEQEAETPEKKTAQSGNAAPEVIGEEPKEVETSRVFLRETTVTLTPGQLELEFPLSYDRDDLLGFRRRQIAFTPTLRAGLLERLEGNIDLPLVWREHQTVPRPVTRPEAEDDTAGIGDISVGLKYVILPEVGALPNVVGLLNVLAPSGKAPNPNAAIQASTGTGRWRTFFGLSAIRSFDPAVVFGGIGYEVNFDATLNDVEVSGANRFTYNFGTGFAVNNQLTLSGAFLGEYREKLKFNGRELPGTDIEPMSMRASLTYRAARGQFIEPSVEWGLNDDAVDTRIRISYILRL